MKKVSQVKVIVTRLEFLLGRLLNLADFEL